MKNIIIEQMKLLGFTGSEAQAYTTLLKSNPATGYEISKQSGIPRSAIYSVMDKLEAAGLVNAMSSNPKQFIPLEPEKLFAKLSSDFQHTIEELRQSFSEYKTETSIGHLWNIQGYEQMIRQAKEIINGAKKTIHLSVWNREFEELKKELKNAKKRGVNIVIFSFTDIVEKIGNIVSYELNEKDLMEIWDHKIILVVDCVELLMGEADRNKSKKVAWTENKAIVTIALNHIILDITLYGLRYGVDVSKLVQGMHEGDMNILDKLLQDKSLQPNGIKVEM